jgi:hypothetical protein
VAQESESSSLYLREFATGPYPEPGDRIVHPPASVPKIHFNPIYASVVRLVSLLRDFPEKPCTFSLLPCVPHVPPISFSLGWIGHVHVWYLFRI